VKGSKEKKGKKKEVSQRDEQEHKIGFRKKGSVPWLPGTRHRFVLSQLAPASSIGCVSSSGRRKKAGETSVAEISPLFFLEQSCLS